MIFQQTNLEGAYIIELEPFCDERGYFARTWCAKEFLAHGLSTKFVQSNHSFNKQKGTVRGMHFQILPYQEAKLVRCVRGAIYDVIIDLRPNSKTFKKWISVLLNENNNRMLYVPEGFAHGFQTLEDETEVLYQVSEFYSPKHEAGIRYNDPTFNIVWPITEHIVISTKDQSHKDFER